MPESRLVCFVYVRKCDPPYLFSNVFLSKFLSEELRLGVGINVKAILSLITVLFDYESRHPAFMPIAKFQRFVGRYVLVFMPHYHRLLYFHFRTIEQLRKLFEILKNNPKDLEISESITEETESVLVRGCFICILSFRLIKIVMCEGLFCPQLRQA